MKRKIFFIVLLLTIINKILLPDNLNYSIVETGVIDFYNNLSLIDKPERNEAFYGQDAHYQGNIPSYTDNLDGTVTDNITGLMWQKNMGEKITFEDAFYKADTLSLGGYSDWRVPSIKELYSLILFTGRVNGTIPYELFIDTAYFIQPYGDTTAGERLIDAQTWSSTQYKSVTMNGDSTVFGVNFLDGRIKGYPKYYPNSNNQNPRYMYFRFVRGNPEYGKNQLINNGDGTISDLATGLMWMQADDGISRNWEDALSYSENLEFAGYSDWRLPNAKELHSIVNYERCPDVTHSPAIDPLFSVTEITDPLGNNGQYPYFWTSTTHLDGNNPYSGAAYIAFGEAQGKMNQILMDVHGAGAQRSDPKDGNPDDYPDFFGPQGDVRYVFNYVRCVRTIDAVTQIYDSFDNKNYSSAMNYFQIVPNPHNGIFEVFFDKQGLCHLSIYQVTGKKVYSQYYWNDNSCFFDISEYANGIYLVELEYNGNSICKKMTKIE